MEDLNRTFIGIRLPAETQQRLREVQVVLRQKSGADVARWVPPENLQFVILSLGELMVGTFDQVRRKLIEVCAEMRPFQLGLEGIGGTPSALQPRFVWLGVGGGLQELILLHNSLETGVRPFLSNYQAKPFVPHIDLGRLKIESEQNRTALGRAVRMSQLGCVAELNVSQIELFRGTASSMGPSLASEGAFALGG